MKSHIDPGNAGGGGVVIPDTWMDVPHQFVPKIFECEFCNKKFTGIENEGEFHKHLYEKHPIIKPVLIIQNEELGQTKKLIYQNLSLHDIQVKDCTKIVVNNETKTLDEFKKQLTNKEKNFFKIELYNDRFLNPDSYEIEFLISSNEVLDAIDSLFIEHFLNRKLLPEEIVILTEKLKPYISNETRPYVDSYISYLYGILAKEQMEGILTTFTQYQDKFKSSVETLKNYTDRPLAQVVYAIQLFNLNFFDSTEKLSIFCPAVYYTCRFIKFGELVNFDNKINIPIDWITKKIIDLVSCDDIDELMQAELLLKSGFIPNADKNKLALILLRKYKSFGYNEKASNFVKLLKNNPDFEKILNNIMEVENG
jgi:hypothetical protein